MGDEEVAANKQKARLPQSSALRDSNTMFSIADLPRIASLVSTIPRSSDRETEHLDMSLSFRQGCYAIAA